MGGPYAFAPARGGMRTTPRQGWPPSGDRRRLHVVWRDVMKVPLFAFGAETPGRITLQERFTDPCLATATGPVRSAFQSAERPPEFLDARITLVGKQCIDLWKRQRAVNECFTGPIDTEALLQVFEEAGKYHTPHCSSALHGLDLPRLRGRHLPAAQSISCGLSTTRIPVLSR